MLETKRKMVLILGVTGSGKGRLAFELARTIDAEIISIDSMKVYRRMNIGTAKPSKQHRAEINYHLIDVVEPSQAFSAGEFLKLTNDAIEQIARRKKNIIAVGGTALYIKSLLYGLFEGPGSDDKIRRQLKKRAETEGMEQLYKEFARTDPVAAERIHPNDSKRIIRALEVYQITGKPISSFQQQWVAQNTTSQKPATKHKWTLIGLRREKTEENKRINARVKRMIETGLVEEVKALLAEDKPLSKQARCAIGYAEIIDHLQGKTPLPDAIELIKKNSRRMAKHQRTWFKTFDNVKWLDIETKQPHEQILAQTQQLLETIS